MLIQIDGWFGSGKAVLWTLLDGHPDVFCSPIHDYSYAGFLNQANDYDWVMTKHIEIVRKILARTQYYKFEKVFWDGYWTFEFSTNEILKLPYKYDFYKHDQLFVKELMDMDDWCIENILDILYKNVFISKKEDVNKFKKIPKYFATASNALFINDYKYFPQVFPNGKSIHVRRDIEKIIAIRSKRKPRPEDFKTKTFFSDNFEKRINNGEIEKILRYNDEYDDLIKRYPNQFSSVNFDDLVFNTVPTMKGIAEFLNIELNPKLYIASYDDIELKYENKKFIGEETDRVEDLLTQEERLIIKNQIEKYYSTK